MSDVRKAQKVGKLVRDRIPFIIAAKGEHVRWHVAKKKELPGFLLAKLKEETAELIAVLDEPNKAEEEIADVMEVMSTIICLANVDEKPLLCRVESETTEAPVNLSAYAPLLWDAVQPFGQTFGEPERLSRHLRVLMNLVEWVILRGGLRPMAVCFHLVQKRETRGGFNRGIILDEA